MYKSFISLAFVVLAAACSSSPSPAIGTWTVATGSQSTLTCGTQMTVTPISGTIFFTNLNGLQGNIQSCSEPFSEAGNTLTASSVPCAVETADGGTAVLTIGTDEVTITADDTSLSEQALGSQPDGHGGSCMFSRMLSAHK